MPASDALGSASGGSLVGAEGRALRGACDVVSETGRSLEGGGRGWRGEGGGESETRRTPASVVVDSRGRGESRDASPPPSLASSPPLPPSLILLFCLPSPASSKVGRSVLLRPKPQESRRHCALVPSLPLRDTINADDRITHLLHLRQQSHYPHSWVPAVAQAHRTHPY